MPDQPIQTKSATNSTENPAATPANEPSAFDELWGRFETEGAFGLSAFEQEKSSIEAEIIRLEAQIEKQRQMLSSLATRANTAKAQMKALLAAGLTPDAVLSAMRVQYRLSKPSASAARETTVGVTEEDKSIVLAALTNEPATLGDLRKRLSRDLPNLSAVLKALLDAGQVEKVGERRSTRYKLADGTGPATPSHDAPPDPLDEDEAEDE